MARRRPGGRPRICENPRRHPVPQDGDEVGGDEEEEGEEGEAGARQQPGAGPSGQPPRAFRRGEPAGRRAIYNVEAMHDKLEDFGWIEEAAFDETQAITHGDPEQVKDVDDDLARELAFYNQVRPWVSHARPRDADGCVGRSLHRRRGGGVHAVWCLPAPA
jgi:hypothetical protein